jgi:hypothetical protein
MLIRCPERRSRRPAIPRLSITIDDRLSYVLAGFVQTETAE